MYAEMVPAHRELVARATREKETSKQAGSVASDDHEMDLSDRKMKPIGVIDLIAMRVGQMNLKSYSTIPTRKCANTTMDRENVERVGDP